MAEILIIEFSFLVASLGFFLKIHRLINSRGELSIKYIVLYPLRDGVITRGFIYVVAVFFLEGALALMFEQVGRLGFVGYLQVAWSQFGKYPHEFGSVIFGMLGVFLFPLMTSIVWVGAAVIVGPETREVTYSELCELAYLRAPKFKVVRVISLLIVPIMFVISFIFWSTK